MESSVGYARVGAERVYYKVIGSGPLDLVVNSGGWGSIDLEWDDPGVRLFYQKLARLGRVVQFDGRGSGASDPMPLDGLPPWESFVEELEGVMDEVGSERATVLGIADGGPVSMLFAANQPDRVNALILASTFARLLSDADYSFGIPAGEADDYIGRVGENWGSGKLTALWAPSRAEDQAFVEWLAKVERSTYSPAAAEAYAHAFTGTDARAILPAIRVPTLVLHVADNPMIPIEYGRFIADRIEGATLVEIPGTDAFPYWDQSGPFVAAVEDFLTGVGPTPIPDRRLATVLMTDIVHSTRRVAELGDRSWKDLLDVHDETSQQLIHRHEGELIKSTGDGVLATFDGPGRAIGTAIELQDELAKVQIQLRAGIHAGEIESRGDDVSGIAIHLAARVMAEAHPGDILVSRTVRDLVIGSGIMFSDRGAHRLKGIEGEWHLYSVERPHPIDHLGNSALPETS